MYLQICAFIFSLDKAATSATIDNDGWHHTGDVGEWLNNGCLKIIDRKKHIFKLSQGEYIVPEKIESIYIKSPYVEQGKLNLNLINYFRGYNNSLL